MGVESEDKHVVRHRPAIGSTEIARRLRTNPTDAERQMRTILREHFSQMRFRRQVPIRGFFADFCSHRARLVIEVDGGQHSEEADRDRTVAMEAEGYRVVRFWNHDVLANADGVAISLAETLHQRHPHQGEGN